MNLATESGREDPTETPASLIGVVDNVGGTVMPFAGEEEEAISKVLLRRLATVDRQERDPTKIQ